MTKQRMDLSTTTLRYFWVSLLPIVLAMAAGAAIAIVPMARGNHWWMIGWWVLGGLAGTALVAGLGAQRARIELRDGVLDGPGPWGRRLRATSDDIDRERSLRRNRFQRLVGEQLLWLKNGERMILNHRWYERGDLAALLREVGVATEETSAA